jgi:radical SAM superfamily enzyme YgiQ (UPF0313 family)
MKILFVLRVIDYIDPMAVELLSALARRAGHSTFLSVLEQDDLEADVRRIKPDVVAMSAITGEHRYYLQAAEVIKKMTNVPIVIGGPHCTFFPEVIEHPAIDAVGVGECDDAWPELLVAIERGGDRDVVKNIFTKENWFGRFKNMEAKERGCHLGSRMPTTTLDSLPFLDRELVRNHPGSVLKDFPMLVIMASRGCPFECTYCFEPKFNQMYRGKGAIYNRYSVRRLCAEINDARQHCPTQFVKFYDDMFFVSKTVDPWLEEFAKVYPQEVGLPFFCLTRCNVLTEAHMVLLKHAGLHSLTMSIEAGNDYIRSNVIKRHMTRKEILDAYNLCRKYEVVTFANSILGIPVRPEIMAEQGMTALDYDIESLDINIQAGVTFAEFGTAYPYPGCELSEYVVKNGWFDSANFDTLHTSYNAESPLNCFSPKEKLQQRNLELLGTPLVAFPWLWNFGWFRRVFPTILSLPLSRLYFVLYYLTKGYLTTFRVYPMKFGVRQLVKNVLRSVVNEWRKHSPGKTLYQRPSTGESATHQMLGGPPRI